jgi:DNA-binding transcriptional LysR family regulator
MDLLVAMKAFVSAVHEGGLTRGGSKVGMSPAAMTRSIQSIEQRLGRPLFTRSGPRLWLTDEGRVAYGKAQKVLQALEDFNETLNAEELAELETVRVGCPPEVHEFVLSPAYPAFQSANPGIMISFEITGPESCVQDPRVDVSVRIGSSGAEGMLTTPLLPYPRWTFVAAPELPTQQFVLSGAHDFRQLRVLGLATGITVWQLYRRRDHSDRVEVSFESYSSDAKKVLTAVIRGEGLGLLPDWLVGTSIRSGQLVRVFPRWKVVPASADADVYACYRSSLSTPPNVRIALDFLMWAFKKAANVQASLERSGNY